ncbi:UNVERIFIED_CONTAM: exosome nuclease subunit [Siphonaria sp. JEL0065]|nr:exosome nuclease subunit [Siphonaria sp. JEL0065]
MSGYNSEQTLEKLATVVQGSQFLATKELFYHVTSSDSANAAVATASNSLLNLLNVTLKSVANGNFRPFSGKEDVVERFDVAVEHVDALLEQLALFKALHAWRDHVARIEDESVRYVTPTNMFTSIASELPTDMKSLQGCCHPMMPNLMKVYAQDVLLLIERTRLSELEYMKTKEEEAFKTINELDGKPPACTSFASTPSIPARVRFDGMDVDTNTAKKSTALKYVSLFRPISTQPLIKTKTNILVTRKLEPESALDPT